MNNIKKTMLFLIMFSSFPVWAECLGTQKTGADGYQYCRSNVSMNWWSAIAWCEATGMQLISLDRCNGRNGDITGDNSCPNFKGKVSSFLTSSTPSYNKVYAINSSGEVSQMDRTYGSYYALCE